MEKIILFCLISLFTCAGYAQVTVGAGIDPLSGALLDLKEQAADPADNTTANRGLLLPRVNLSKKDMLYPMFEDKNTPGQPTPDYDQSPEQDAENSAHTGLTVYNLTDDCVFCPGVYAWSGTLWERLMEPCCPRLKSVQTLGYLSLVAAQGDLANFDCEVKAEFDNDCTGSTTYQWYESTNNQNTGGTAIAGATSNPYRYHSPSGASDGQTFYVYCVVTNACNGKSLASGVYTVLIETPT